MNTAGFATVNPSTGEQIETFSYFAAAQTEDVIAREQCILVHCVTSSHLKQGAL